VHAAKRGIRFGGFGVFSIDEPLKHCLHLVMLRLVPPHTTAVHGRVRVLSYCMFTNYLFLIFKRTIWRRRDEWENASIIIFKFIVWCVCLSARVCVCVRHVCERDRHSMRVCMSACLGLSDEWCRRSPSACETVYTEHVHVSFIFNKR